MGEQVVDHAHEVGHVDPAVPLAAAAEPGRQAEEPGQCQRLEGAALARQHDADAQASRGDAEGLHLAGRFFPCHGQLGEKAAGARRAVFVHPFVGPIAVIADGGGGDVAPGFYLQLGKRVAQQQRRIDATGDQLLLAGFRPRLIGNAGTCQVDHGIHPLEGRAIDVAGAHVPVPGRVIAYLLRMARQQPHFIALLAQKRTQVAAYESRAASDEDGFHCDRWLRLMCLGASRCGVSDNFK